MDPLKERFELEFSDRGTWNRSWHSMAARRFFPWAFCTSLAASPTGTRKHPLNLVGIGGGLYARIIR